ncbi:DNA cytosine methyltransferase [Roseibium polysiphoniae]|uniref:Cytosine-specific methyltransferase n=1 Tax=Roseibium polysiphoniae TaxID=2571221 RepID=A0ABR9CCP5_9HYPH|nr:DNA (cytosine-5-)-methyltransferase [Roseibium polysiphoniae]MBD8877659.1 DNA (cytosine-5-)-methyltransferase [Roseibium polysiphoniae]
MKAVELFCGAGGMTEGLKQAGWDILFGYDNWGPALKIYKANHPKTVFRGHPRSRYSTKVDANVDLADVLKIAYDLEDYDLDVICGGPPCQDYSTAGSRKEGDKARMTVAFASAIVTRRPEWFFMENVERAQTSKTYQKARGIFKRAGYGLTEEVVDASYYGVPQSRKRLIVVGRLGERDGFLTSAIKKARSERPMTLRDAFGTSIGVHPGDGFPEDARAIRISRRRRTTLSIDEPCLTIVSTASAPRAGEQELHAPKGPNGKADYADPAAIPFLTFQEMALIQGFPINYDWSGVAEGKHAGGLAVANAVPPPLAAALGRVIKERHEGKSMPAIEPGFDTWLRQTKGQSDSVARNRKSQLNRARRLLKGRTFSNPALEIAELDADPQYQSLPDSTRSDLKKALQLNVEWQDVYLPRQARRSSEIKTLKGEFKEYRFPVSQRKSVLERFEELFDSGHDDALKQVRLTLPWKGDFYFDPEEYNFIDDLYEEERRLQNPTRRLFGKRNSRSAD